MRTKADILEALSRLEGFGAIDGFVHDGGLLGTPASEDVIVSISANEQYRYTWRELAALLDGVEVGRYLTSEEVTAIVKT